MPSESEIRATCRDGEEAVIKQVFVTLGKLPESIQRLEGQFAKISVKKSNRQHVLDVLLMAISGTPFIPTFIQTEKLQFLGEIYEQNSSDH